jgi:hypothetical protein
MEIVGTFYDHLVYFTSSWYILWPFGKVCGHLVYFSRFGIETMKNLATLVGGVLLLQQKKRKGAFDLSF